MKVRVSGAIGVEYAHVTEEAIERLRVPDDLRIPGVPNSIENIASQCSLFRLFGITSTAAALVRYVPQGTAAIIVTGEGTADSPYSSCGLLTRDDDRSIAFCKIGRERPCYASVGMERAPANSPVLKAGEMKEFSRRTLMNIIEASSDLRVMLDEIERTASRWTPKSYEAFADSLKRYAEVFCRAVGCKCVTLAIDSHDDFEEIARDMCRQHYRREQPEYRKAWKFIFVATNLEIENLLDKKKACHFAHFDKSFHCFCDAHEH